MDKKDRIRRQLRSCAEQMQQLLDQLNPNHKISQSLKASISQIRHFNKFDQPNVLSLWQDLLHEPRALPFRVEEFSRQEQSKSLLDRRAERSHGIPILLVDTGNNREEGLPGVQKKVEAHDILDEFHDAPLKLKVMRKRENDDEDELLQPDNERGGGLLEDEKKLEGQNITENRHRPATKWKVVRKRKNSADYDGDDELNQPDTKRVKSFRKHVCIAL
ncbi:uncharacterized protein FTJAE_13772 [Fusarium tjaetaba]|uniref:Uncharacterized protein n=1 Tax=Fusarium tjaetaba TaxID=1567544 RepID=A0A8H5QCV1_9HYPO|nr:uncharacterized protein FTJAE_13772 [Fusarium tjaetaba]KAF5614095.1 hypothetical protein FTJAE_13772 [Fusarium tjaetaba]